MNPECIRWKLQKVPIELQWLLETVMKIIYLFQLSSNQMKIHFWFYPQQTILYLKCFVFRHSIISKIILRCHFLLLLLNNPNQWTPQNLKFWKKYLPRTDVVEVGQIPDSNLMTVAGGEEQFVVWAKRQGRVSFWVAVDGRPYRRVRWIDDSDRFIAGAGDEWAVWWDGERPTCVELFKWRHAPIILLQG